MRKQLISFVQEIEFSENIKLKGGFKPQRPCVRPWKLLILYFSVCSIDFQHSSRKAWRTINKLTGRSGRSSRFCPVSANSIALHRVENGAHRTGGHESTRLVHKRLSDLRKVSTPEGHNISDPFRPEVLAAALRHLKLGKSPGLDSAFPEFILHTGSALKSWFCDFLTSCMRQCKIPKIWRRALTMRSLSQKSHWRTQRATVAFLCCVSSLKSSRGSSTLVSNQSSTHCP